MKKLIIIMLLCILLTSCTIPPPNVIEAQIDILLPWQYDDCGLRMCWPGDPYCHGTCTEIEINHP